MVLRSALTLKLLTSERHGSIVAAPTFGLPERIGGARNWDYRFTWIRDASFTLYGLMRLGFTDESAAFMKWVEARCAELEPDGSLQIMYGIDGRRDIPEEELPNLAGYLDSRPVRVGNAAGGADAGAEIVGRLAGCAFAEIKVRRNRRIAVMRNLAGRLDVPLIPAGRVMHEHDAGERARTQRPGDIGRYRLVAVAVERNGLRDHAYVSRCCLPCW